jgi:uncharacterized protein YbjT (DUF2867 family)
MTRTVLVTGATGTVGRHVVDELTAREGPEQDLRIRVAVRDPDDAAERFDADEFVAFDLEKPETWGETLADVDGAFLLRPPTVDTDDVTAFVDALGGVGVEHVTYLSTLGAEKNVLIPHHRIEKRIAESGVDYTFLRASFFMQNLTEVHGREIRERGEIAVPAGDGETSFVDARDLGAVAATVLTEPGHRNRSYDLTGSEALTYREVARVLSDVTGREVRYRSPSVPAFVAHRRDLGDPLPFALLMVAIYGTARLGLAGRVTDAVERLLGRPPRDLRTFAEDYAEELRPRRPVSGSRAAHADGSESATGNDGAPSDAPSSGHGATTDQDVEAATTGQYVETRGPPVPEVAYRVINPVMKGVLRSPLHSLVSDSLMLLTFRGRRSGDEYTIPVGYWVRDGKLVVSTHSQWWHNFEGGQPVILRLRGERRRGIATPHPDPETVAEYMQTFIDRNGVDAARRLGIAVDGDREPTREELEAGVEGTVVVEIELTDGDASG